MFLEKFPELLVDGDRGPLTNKRIVGCKFYLGYEGGPQLSKRVTPLFRKRLSRPTSSRFLPAEMIELGKERRRDQHERARQPAGAGATLFEGRRVATWIKPYLDFARRNGWKGTLTSGFRDPAESEQLCISQCGKPSCPGTCAGRKSNHSGNKKPKGAIDVSDIATFTRLMESCPLKPRIFNALGAADPEHFSTTGR
jgi:hypothetical protein